MITMIWREEMDTFIENVSLDKILKQQNTYFWTIYLYSIWFVK